MGPRALVASCLAAAAIVAPRQAAHAQAQTAGHDPAVLLARVAAYLKADEEQFSAVVAEETTTRR